MDAEHFDQNYGPRKPLFGIMNNYLRHKKIHASEQFLVGSALYEGSRDVMFVLANNIANNKCPDSRSK
jgi:histidinol phosphatase-like enzyme